MNCLVVGSTSTLGSAVAERLATGGIVLRAGRENADFPLDLSQPLPAIDASFDVVINAAAAFGGQESSQIISAVEVNAVGALRVCELAERVGAKRVVHISSWSALDASSDSYYGIYSLSKKQGEEIAKYYCSARGLPLTIVRPSQLYDAAGRCRMHQPLLYSFADKAEQGEDIVIQGSHDPVRNYLFLDDMVEWLVRVIDRDISGTFNCGHPRPATFGTLARAAFAAFDRGGTLRFDREKPNIPDRAHYDVDDICKCTGYWPTVDVDEGMYRIARQRSSTD
jgi:nucleoside-diphosphate-sugar epimerase